MLRRTTVALIGSALMLAMAGPAWGLQRGSITVKDEQSFSQDFPGIVGMFPNALTHTELEECRGSDACAVTQLNVVPKDPKNTILHVELTWDDPSETNDLDFFFWDDAGVEVAASATSANPEVLGAADLEPGTYWLGVLNWSGVNTGYTLSGSLRQQDVTIFQAPAPTTPKSVLPAVAADSAAPPAPPAIEAEAGVAAEVIAVPGADGANSTLAIGGLDAAQRASALNGGVGISTIVFLSLTIAIGVAGALFVVTRIRHEVAAAAV